MSPSELLDLIVARAPGLIAVGVTSLSVEGLSVTLVKPAAPDAPAAKPTPVAKQHIDPLRDASTYPGGKVPGFTREEDR